MTDPKTSLKNKGQYAYWYLHYGSIPVGDKAVQRVCSSAMSRCYQVHRSIVIAIITQTTQHPVNRNYMKLLLKSPKDRNVNLYYIIYITVSCSNFYLFIFYLLFWLTQLLLAMI